jgi:hypothetical protein
MIVIIVIIVIAWTGQEEVKEASWAAGGTAALASSGGIIEQIEVELTEILLQCEGEGRDGRGGAAGAHEQDLAMAKRQARELGDKLAKAKEQCA